MRRTLLGLVAVVAVLQWTAPGVARETVSLAGNWQFRMDPNDAGITERWYGDAVAFDQTVAVPGAWNAQSIGKASEKLYHEFAGPGWYRRDVPIPPAWQGQIVWLKFGGVHRRATVWVNGAEVGSHVGYLAPFKFDISAFVRGSATARIVVRVDARPAKDDALTGCIDIIDGVFATWGGLHRSVDIEATGPVWVEDVYVVPHISPATAEVRVELGARDALPDGLSLKVEVTDQSGGRAGGAEQKLTPGARTATVTVPIAQPKLWSPSQPHLYTARVTLLAGNAEVDAPSTRFGLREIKVEGGRILLNGQPIFFRGYGDDCIYPYTIAPPADKAEYYRRFKIAKDYGFNYVRHHSWWPLAEYFDVADELGIMLQPEFPIAYQNYFDGAGPEARKLYVEQWQAAIKASRNHPSIVTWCMGNELSPKDFTLAPELHRLARELDPTRLIIMTDGLAMPAPTDAWGSLVDFVTPPYNEPGSIGLDDHKYGAYGPLPAKPIVIHEMSNFASLPDPSQSELFHDGIRPFWLEQYRQAIAKAGVGARVPSWVSSSNKLQAVCLKTNLEAARRSSAVSGYDQWLLQDYWTGSTGVLDTFYRPKGLTAAEFRRFNSPTVLLMECSRRSFWCAEQAKITFLVSRFEDAPSDDATLKWELRDGNKVVNSGTAAKLRVSSDGVQKLTEVTLTMPTQADARKLTLSVELHDEHGKISNEWNLWVFPSDRLGADAGKLRVAGLERLRTLYPGAELATGDAKLAGADLLVTARFIPGSLAYLTSGGRMLLLSPDDAFAAQPTMYKPYWWLPGGPSDSTGTVIDQAHPALKCIPNDGWCDLVFYPLLTGSSSFVLDGLPVKVEPIVRCLDTHVGLVNRAFLAEFAVGRGKLLVSSLNFKGALDANDPAGSFLLDRLIRYALSPQFAPTAVLPPDFLKLAETRAPTPPNAPRVNGFVRMLSSSGPPDRSHTHRGDVARCWYVRQSDGAQQMSWETAPARREPNQVSLVWTAGTGFISEPRGSFALSLNGKPLLDFDVTHSSRVWTSADGRSELFFDVKEAQSQDSFGVMYLTVPAALLTEGQPATLSVTGSKTGSRRWFMVFDFSDTLEHEK